MTPQLLLVIEAIAIGAWEIFICGLWFMWPLDYNDILPISFQPFHIFFEVTLVPYVAKLLSISSFIIFFFKADEPDNFALRFMLAHYMSWQSELAFSAIITELFLIQVVRL